MTTGALWAGRDADEPRRNVERPLTPAVAVAPAICPGPAAVYAAAKKALVTR